MPLAPRATSSVAQGRQDRIDGQFLDRKCHEKILEIQWATSLIQLLVFLRTFVCFKLDYWAAQLQVLLALAGRQVAEKRDYLMQCVNCATQTEHHDVIIA